MGSHSIKKQARLIRIWQCRQPFSEKYSREIAIVASIAFTLAVVSVAISRPRLAQSSTQSSTQSALMPGLKQLEIAGHSECIKIALDLHNGRVVDVESLAETDVLAGPLPIIRSRCYYSWGNG